MPFSRRCVARSALFALLALAAAPAAPALTVERAGTDGAVATLVDEEATPVVALIWPRARALEGGELPAGSAVVAAWSVLDGVGAGEGFVLPRPDGLLLGARLPGAGAGELIRAARVLADARPPEEAGLAAVLEDLASEPARPGTALGSARAASLAGAGAWDAGRLARGTAASRARIRASDVREVLDRVRDSGARVRAIGPAGLSPRIAAALGESLTPEQPPEAPRPAPAGLVESVAARAPGRDVAAVAHLFLIERELVEELGASLTLLRACLVSGEGSLAQRASVALGESSRGETQVRFEPLGEGRLGLFLGIPVAPGALGRAREVLEGVAASLRALELRPDRIYRARRSLDEAGPVLGDPFLTALVDGEGGLPTPWPPRREAGRLDGGDVLAVARAVLDPEARVEAVSAPPRAGRTPAEALHLFAALSGWELVADPGAAPERASDAEAIRVARRAFDTLAPGWDPRRLPISWRAEYTVEEETPLGAGLAPFVVEHAEGETWTRLGRQPLAVEAEAGPVVLEAVPPGQDAPALALPAGGAVVAHAWGEPVVVAAAVAAGRVGAEVRAARCGDRPCRALVVRFAEGGAAALDLAGEARRPVGARRWWSGQADGPPDVRESFESWRSLGGIDVVERRRTEDRLGVTRTIELDSWSWRRPAHR
jgi:hypothetical protein